MENRKQKKLAPSSQKSFKARMKYLIFLATYTIQAVAFFLVQQTAKSDITVYIASFWAVINALIFAMLIERIYKKAH